MKVIIESSLLHLEATGEELIELETLIGYCCDNNLAMDGLYEYISKQLRSRIVIKTNMPAPPT